MTQPYVGEQYRMRASTPMAVSTTVGTFVWHTFMAEVTTIDIYDCYKATLPGSEEFRGQGGDYMSAQFTRLGATGVEAFQGRITYKPEYIDESALGFNY